VQGDVLGDAVGGGADRAGDVRAVAVAVEARGAPEASLRSFPSAAAITGTARARTKPATSTFFISGLLKIF